MTGKRTFSLIAAIILLAVAFYLWGSSKTPPGQPPLVSLNQSNVADFQGAFNACCWRYTDRTASISYLTEMSAGGLCSRTHFGAQSFNVAANLGALGADASD